MADNTVLNAGSGGDTVASDDIAGVKHQRVKVSLGADGSATDALGGAGAVAAGVQRTTLASDDPAVVALQIVDDWDESDRAKVNPIVGQAGVAAGAGAVGATVQRTTLASDDPAVAALQIIDDIVYTDDTSTHATGTSKGALFMAAAAPTDASVNANDIGAVAMTTDRKLHVSVQDAIPAGTNNIGDVDVLTLPAIPAGNNNIGDVDVASIAAGDNNIGNVDIVSLPALAAGTNNIGDVDVLTVPADPFGANADAVVAAGATGSIQAKLRRVTQGLEDLKTLIVLAAGNNNIGDVDVASLVPGTGATNLGKAEDAQHTSGDVGVMMLGVRAAAPTERSAGPTDADYVPIGVNEVGAQWSTLTPSANGGLTTFMASGSDGSSILVATAQAVKASAGVLYGYYAYNPEAAVSFVHFYNTAAASVTVGTTNPMFTIAIPAGSAANLALPYGITFSNAGWSVAATTTAGGNTAPATGVSLVAWYK